jgi:hypothetical protein
LEIIIENSTVQGVTANIAKIVNTAEKVVVKVLEVINKKPELAILVSCIGSKFILDCWLAEEIEEVIEVVGRSVVIIGLYSYAEMPPFNGERSCQLHSQTMALTLRSAQCFI